MEEYRRAHRVSTTNAPRRSNTGPSRYVVPGVKGDVGEKGGSPGKGPAEIGEPGATWRVGLELVNMKTCLVRGRGERVRGAGRASATNQATREGRGRRNEATNRIATAAPSGGRAENLPERCPGSA